MTMEANVPGSGAKIKLAYLVAEYPVISETFVYREIRMLRRLGYEVELFALHQKPRPDSLNVADLPSVWALYGRSVPEYLSALRWAMKERPDFFNKAKAWLKSDLKELSGIRNRLKLWLQFAVSCSLARQLVERHIEHVHVHFIHSPCQVAMYATGIANVPYTVTAHANDIYSRGELLLQKGLRAKHLVTISDYNKRYFASLGIPEEKVIVIRCILDFPELDQPPAGSSGRFVFGSLGRMVPKKGFATLIRAFDRFLKTFEGDNKNRPLLQVAGSGPQEAELKALVEQLGLQHSVEFLGALAPERVLPWMQSIDSFVLACEVSQDGDVDGIPVVLMEAMACHLPVVSTRLSGIPELVKHEETGYLVEPGDTSALATVLGDLVTDRERALAMGQAASAFLDQEFSKDVNMVRLLRCFHS